MKKKPTKKINVKSSDGLNHEIDGIVFIEVRDKKTILWRERDAYPGEATGYDFPQDVTAVFENAIWVKEVA